MSTQIPRLVVHPPAPGAWLMAVDEALLDSAIAGVGPTLRFYQWSEPTVSLGYFQSASQRESHAPSRDCPLVRRQTGGGAIVHDRELTYSLALPAELARSRTPTVWYELVHGALSRALAGFVIVARSVGVDVSPHAAVEPFLCFQRRAAADLLAGGMKVCGSAQRSRRGAILQHGSLLLAKSTYAPEIPGLAEIAEISQSPSDWIDAWQSELAAAMAIEFERTALSAGELQAAEQLVSEKYSTDAWNRRRSAAPPAR